MTLHCPVCKSKYTVDDLIKEGIKDEMIELASFFGKNWGLVNEYVDCFRASQWGSVGEKKKARLLKEIKALFESCEFNLDGKRYRTDRSAILGAVRAVCDTEKFGFKNHNYLKRVMMGPSTPRQAQGSGCADIGKRPERISAEGLTANEEKEREEAKRQKIRGQRTDPSTGSGRAVQDDREEITGAEYLKKHDISSLLDKIGKGVK